MKICAISDLHGHLPQIPECDLLLIAGDIGPYWPSAFQYHWLRTEFKDWLSQQTAFVVGIAGNHDTVFEDYPEDVDKLNLPWTYLQDSSVMFKGLKIYGTPWTVQYYDWPFMAEDIVLADKWSMIPEDTNILLVHGPPKYYGDLVSRGTHEGSETLLLRLMDIKPELTVFGHIHEGRGDWAFFDGRLANVTITSKTEKGHEYNVYQPWVYDLN